MDTITLSRLPSQSRLSKENEPHNWKLMRRILCSLEPLSRHYLRDWVFFTPWSKVNPISRKRPQVRYWSPFWQACLFVFRAFLARTGEQQQVKKRLKNNDRQNWETVIMKITFLNFIVVNNQSWLVSPDLYEAQKIASSSKYHGTFLPCLLKVQLKVSEQSSHETSFLFCSMVCPTSTKQQQRQ